MSASSSSSNSKQTQQSINLEDMSLQQLQKIKTQLESEINGLSTAFTQMKQAQGAFRECKACIGTMRPENQDKTVLIPLSNSLYVPGKLSNFKSVVMDVGTGYYVEKSTEDASVYYDEKIEYVQENAKKIQDTVEQKQASYRGLLEIMQYKMTQQQKQQQQQQKEGSSREPVTSAS